MDAHQGAALWLVCSWINSGAGVPAAMMMMMTAHRVFRVKNPEVDLRSKCLRCEVFFVHDEEPAIDNTNLGSHKVVATIEQNHSNFLQSVRERASDVVLGAGLLSANLMITAGSHPELFQRLVLA